MGPLYYPELGFKLLSRVGPPCMMYGVFEVSWFMNWVLIALKQV